MPEWNNKKDASTGLWETVHTVWRSHELRFAKQTSVSKNPFSLPLLALKRGAAFRRAPPVRGAWERCKVHKLWYSKPVVFGYRSQSTEGTTVNGTFIPTDVYSYDYCIRSSPASCYNSMYSPVRKVLSQLLNSKRN